MPDFILQTNENQLLTSVLSMKNPSTIAHSLIFRAMTFFQIMTYGSYSILVHLCEENGEIAFSSVTMNFLIELLKLIFSFNAFVYLKQIPCNQIEFFSWFKQSLPYSIPAILYFLNNNLAVHIQIQMDPASYQILSNFKILTTAILYRLIIKQKLTRRQYFALALLFLAGLTYSFGTINKSSSSLSNSSMYIRPLGIPMIIIYCTLSGFAGVYNEWIFKRNYSESIHLQNLFLYAYGTICNLIPMISLVLGNFPSNFLHGFSLYTWLIVLTQVLNGLSMSVVIKYSSNIIRLFIISFSLIITTVLSLLIFHMDLNIYFFISLAVMICALAIFYTHEN